MLTFVFAFSSFSNFGILARQRCQVMPFFLVLICLEQYQTQGSERDRRTAAPGDIQMLAAPPDEPFQAPAPGRRSGPGRRWMMPRAEVRRLLDESKVGTATPALQLLDFDVVVRVPDAALAEHLTRLYAPLVPAEPPATAPHQLTLTATPYRLRGPPRRDPPDRHAARSRSHSSRCVWHANRQAIDRSRDAGAGARVRRGARRARRW